MAPTSRAARLAPVAVIVLLGAAAFARPGDEGGALVLANPDRSRVTELRSALAALPESPAVLIGLDPDLGTYPEIRAVVRAAFDDLLARGAGLAFVSFTPEGRAVASAELDRLERSGLAADQLLDLGFVTGAEAGMVRAVTDIVPADATGGLADAVREAGGGMAAFNMVVVVGGGDLGPRTWVEQVGPRLPSLPIVAIAPTFAQPELAPYLRTGQLVALLATLRDGAAYVASVRSTATAEPDRVPSTLAMLIGMVAALAVIGRSLAGALGGGGGQAVATADGPPGAAPNAPPRAHDEPAEGEVDAAGDGPEPTSRADGTPS